MSASAKRIRQLLSWLGDRDRQLQLALDAAELGTWNWDPATNELVWSERCRTLLGLSADEPPTVDNFLRLVHPDDRAAVGQAIETKLRTSGSPGQGTTVEATVPLAPPQPRIGERPI